MIGSHAVGINLLLGVETEDGSRGDYDLRQRAGYVLEAARGRIEAIDLLRAVQTPDDAASNRVLLQVAGDVDPILIRGVELKDLVLRVEAPDVARRVNLDLDRKSVV